MASIEIETRNDDVVVARMKHGKANALDLEFCNDIVRVLDELAARSTGAVVLTGDGNIFSAGVDLVRYQDEGREYHDAFVPAISDVVLALLRFPRPLVIAVNGHAVAGGCVIACTGDHRIMAGGSGRIGVPELLVGLPFPAAALEAVRFVVAPQHLQAVVYSGTTYSPEGALTVGLVDEVVEASALLDHAVTAAARLGGVPADIFTLTKRQLRAPVLARIAAGATHDAEVVPIWKQPATLARVGDYVERTFKRGKP